MLDVVLWISVGLWGLMAVQFVLNWLAVDDLSKRPVEPFGDGAAMVGDGPHGDGDGSVANGDWPVVSIVVPARNEARCIRQAVTSFCTQEYASFEVVVVDDGSTDSTPEVLAELQARFSNLRVIQAGDLPDGWLGKPNALETGRKAATGEWLLFVDADVVYAPDVLRRAIAYAERNSHDMLFLWPWLITKGVLEAVLMSSLYMAGFTTFPLYLAKDSRIQWFAVGGGAFNLVRREVLEAAGAFESLKNAVVDDIGLGYRVKAAGGSTGVALAGPLVRVRMYDGARETARGFTKNVYPLLRRRPGLAVLALLVGAIVSVVPYLGFTIRLIGGTVSLPASLALVGMHATLGGLAFVAHYPWYVVFLNPVREVGWWYIVFRSYLTHRREGLVWRGRRYGSCP